MGKVDADINHRLGVNKLSPGIDNTIESLASLAAIASEGGIPDHIANQLDRGATIGIFQPRLVSEALTQLGIRELIIRFSPSENAEVRAILEVVGVTTKSSSRVFSEKGPEKFNSGRLPVNGRLSFN